MSSHPGWPTAFAILFGSAVALAILFGVAAQFPR
jgi:hypothetical protein